MQLGSEDPLSSGPKDLVIWEAAAWLDLLQFNGHARPFSRLEAAKFLAFEKSFAQVVWRP